MYKKWFSILMVVVIMMGFFTVCPFTVNAQEVDIAKDGANVELAETGITQSEFNSRLNNLREQYPNYSTWYDSFDGGIQCFGFARLVAYNVFGSHVYDWSISKSMDGVKAGDVVQYGNTSGDGHTIFVLSVSGSTIKYVDCNGNGGYCKVRWDDSVTIGTKIFGLYSFNYRHVSPNIDPDPEPTPDFTPVDVGTDFYANICNMPTYKRVAVAGTNVELKSANGDDSQKWKFERLDDTLYKITNVATGMCMEVSNFGTEDRTNIQVMPWADNDAQKWYFKIVRDGCYSLVPKCAVNSCIDTYGYFDDNTNIQLYHQNATDAQTFALNIQPAFEARNIGNSFVASIIHPSSDMAVTYDLSWNVTINPHSNAKSQQWLFEIMDDRSYKIINLASNMCLDVSNFGTANGTNIQLMPSADNIAQRWFIKAVGNGYSLVPKCACESAIDIDGVIKDGGNNIQLFRQNSYLNQIFSIRRVIDDNMVSVSDVVLNNNSEAVNPQISVKVDNTILKADSDYSVTIEADTTQEKGTVTITGINNYCGNVTKSFSITVIAQTEPTTPPTTPPTEPSIIKLGDVDGDDEVTIIDATCIQRKLASIATAKFVEAAADADEDGELSIIDATVIQRWLAQLPSNENIGKPIA